MLKIVQNGFDCSDNKKNVNYYLGKNKVKWFLYSGWLKFLSMNLNIGNPEYGIHLCRNLNLEILREAKYSNSNEIYCIAAQVYLQKILSI